ncbi:uncharacterized protein LOC115451482 [Manduca sexta]|uniref:uncharacterized protein LOC115451482 n=1 Tax=Manduca sexta TaxID=7130 RepID=UPI00188E0021|nr:uncharacterized protein LOC115451482 [Manduca sexta]
MCVEAKPPPGKEAVWANSTALRVSLLAWGGRCAVRAWSVQLRPARAAAAWAAVPADSEIAEAGGLRPGAWYELRVTAHAPAGDTVALYRAATHTLHGERLGEPVELHTEERRAESEEAGSGRAGADVSGAGGAGGGMPWRAALAPALLAAGLAVLLAALAGAAVLRRQQAWCWRRTCSLHRPRHPHPQLYTTEPGKRNGKTLTPPDGELHEISPYATFSMSGGCGWGGGGGGGGCALHLRTFGRAEQLDLAAPPPRPNLLSHSAEYGRCRDSDSESSGSPCAACAAELYRLPAAHRADTLPAVESSADDTSYSGGGGGGGGGVARRTARAPRRRGEHTSAPTVRYRPAARTTPNLH